MVDLRRVTAISSSDSGETAAESSLDFSRCRFVPFDLLLVAIRQVTQSAERLASRFECELTVQINLQRFSLHQPRMRRANQSHF